jgi:hypothetical protein
LQTKAVRPSEFAPGSGTAPRHHITVGGFLYRSVDDGAGEAAQAVNRAWELWLEGEASMPNLRCIVATLFAAVPLVAASVLASAGPANAAGEILITHAKALAGNVTPGDAAGYPVTISIPGKFQLASNLFVPANKIGIQVTSPYVTIDLNGFVMQGSSVAWYGITGGQHGLVIGNGFITGFKFDGINGTGNRWLVEKLQVDANGRDGIALTGFYQHIHGNIVTGNLARGIACRGCVVSENVVINNGGIGVTATNGATVLGNLIATNTSFGLAGSGLVTGFAHNVITANGNGSLGDQVSGASSLHPNICFNAPC